MAKLTRWDNGETIHETDGDIRATVESADKLGISCFRANLRDANLRYANLRYANLRDANLSCANLSCANLSCANLCDANLSYANLCDANLSYANLRDANLSYANLRDAKHVPMHSRWEVSFTESPSLVVHIGCKTKSIAEWDAIFERIGESMNIALSMFGSHELGSNDDARKIRANYMAIRAYLVALGKHEAAK
jgi:hypothetical protein